MSKLIRNVLVRGIHSACAIGCGWVALWPYFKVVSIDLPAAESLQLMPLILLPFCIAGWLMFFLPTALLFDPQGSRWTIAAWATIGVGETLCFRSLLFLNDETVIRSELLGAVIVVGLVGGTVHGILRR